MSDAPANFRSAADIFANWRDNVLTGQPPVFYPVGTGDLARIEVGPDRVVLIGGPPGSGKTGLTMQLAIDALRLTPALRVLVCNIEMPPDALLDRQLARLSGIDLDSIRYRRLAAEHADRIDRALNTLEPLADRLCFLGSPYDLMNVAASADAFRADLILLDYIQRIPPPGNHADRRGSVDATMNYLRQFAAAGAAVIVVAAVGRTRDSKGRSSYDGEGLNLASFRESSELEFGADDAFMLVPDNDIAGRRTLRHLKSRHGEQRDLVLQFDGACQRFQPVSQESDAAPGGRARLSAALTSLWERTNPAGDDEDLESEG